MSPERFGGFFQGCRFVLCAFHYAKMGGLVKRNFGEGFVRPGSFCADDGEEFDVQLEERAFRGAFGGDAERFDSHDVIGIFNFLQKLDDLAQGFVAVDEGGGALLEIAVSGGARGNLPGAGEIHAVFCLRDERGKVEVFASPVEPIHDGSGFGLEAVVLGLDFAEFPEFPLHVADLGLESAEGFPLGQKDKPHNEKGHKDYPARDDDVSLSLRKLFCHLRTSLV